MDCPTHEIKCPTNKNDFTVFDKAIQLHICKCYILSISYSILTNVLVKTEPNCFKMKCEKYI